MTARMRDRRARLDQAGRSAQSFVRPGAVAGAPTLRAPLTVWASRVGVALVGLTCLSGCVELRVSGPDSPFAIPALALLGFGMVLFLVFSGIWVVVSRKRRRRRVGKILVAGLAGAACGAFWVLFIHTVGNVGRPGGVPSGALTLLGVVTGLSAAMFLLRLGSLRAVVGGSWVTLGFHSLALPIVALISFLVGGAQLSPAGSGGPELRAVLLGVRLAGSMATVGLSVGGLVVGVCLVWVGDRALRARSGRTGGPGVRFNLGRFRD
jgi:hypothetical protein